MLSGSELVSVIMPAFNADMFIAQAIQSILSQSYEDIELLVGIDGCTDNTSQVVKSFSDSRIKIFEWSDNRGNVYTCNYLFHNCKGAYIAIQDADDWSHKDRLITQLNFLRGNERVDLVGTGSVRTNAKGDVVSEVLYPESDFEIRKILQEGKEPCFVCASVMVRASVYQAIGGYRSFFNRIGSADYDWIYRIAERYTLANVAKPLYYNRRHLDSFTKSFNKNPLKQISPQLAFELYRQRITSGIDLLSPEKEQELNEYLAESTKMYRKDPSLIYAEHAKYLYGNKKSGLAARFALMALLKNPFKMDNFLNLLHYLRVAIGK